MIVYLDASALVKRYVFEKGSERVDTLIPEAEALGTALVSRAEVVAALAKAIRVGALDGNEALAARKTFEEEWPDLVRLAISERVVERAAEAAWDHSLRGYDALHLAAANTWKDLLQRPVALATFDRRLWQAAGDEGLRPWPDDLPALLDTWSRASLPPSADGGDTA